MPAGRIPLNCTTRCVAAGGVRYGSRPASRPLLSKLGRGELAPSRPDTGSGGLSRHRHQPLAQTASRGGHRAGQKVQQADSLWRTHFHFPCSFVLRVRQFPLTVGGEEGSLEVAVNYPVRGIAGLALASRSPPSTWKPEVLALFPPRSLP